MRSYETKNRAIQEYLETTFKIRILVQFEDRSQSSRRIQYPRTKSRD